MKAATSVESGTRSPHLGSFVVPLLSEYGEQDDHPVGAVPVGNPPGATSHIEAKLEKTLPEGTTVRQPKPVAVLSEQFNMDRHHVLFVESKREIPLGDLWLQLDLHAPQIITPRA